MIIDNSNSNNDNNDNSLDSVINKFKKLNINNNVNNDQLDNIIDTLGILKFNNNHHNDNINDKYNYIQSYIKVYENLKKEENEKREKESKIKLFKAQPQLIVKENIDQLELLFWKVFRNKFIWFKIFSNFEFKKLFNYERLMDAELILNSTSKSSGINGIEIIRDKVKSSNYLTFNSLEVIYKTFKKETPENIRFYNQLFQNYPSFFISTKESLIVIIKNYNILAFKVFINRFQLDNNQIIEITNEHYRYYTIKSYQSFKMLNYLIINQYLVNYINNDNDNNNNNNNHYSTNISININFIFQQKELTLNKLIKLFKIILFNFKINNIIINDNSNNNCFSNNSTISSNNSNNNNNNSDNKKLLKFFTNIEQNNNNINYQYLDSDIPVLLKEIEPLANCQLDLGYLKILEFLNFIDYIYNNNSSTTKLIISTLNNLQLNNNINQIIKTKYIILKIIKLIIMETGESHIPSFERESICDNLLVYNRIDLLSLFHILNNSNHNNIISNNNRIIEYLSGFKLLLLNEQFEFSNTMESILNLNNIQVIEFIYSNYRDQFESYLESTFIMKIINNIKSYQVLEFFFKNYQDLFFKKHTDVWQYISSLQVIEHFEQLMKSIKRKIFINKFMFTSKSYKFFLKCHDLKDTMPLEVIYRALQLPSPSVYEFSSQFSIESYYPVIENQCEKEDLFISILKLSKIKQFNFNLIPTLIPYKLINWIGNNYIKEFTNESKLDTSSSTSSTSSTTLASSLSTSTSNSLLLLPTVNCPKVKVKLSQSSTLSTTLSTSKNKKKDKDRIIQFEFSPEHLECFYIYTGRCRETFQLFEIMNAERRNSHSSSIILELVLLKEMINHYFSLSCKNSNNISTDNRSSSSNNNNNNNSNNNNNIVIKKLLKFKINQMLRYSISIGYTQVFKDIVLNFGKLLILKEEYSDDNNCDDNSDNNANINNNNNENSKYIVLLDNNDFTNIIQDSILSNNIEILELLQFYTIINKESLNISYRDENRHYRIDFHKDKYLNKNN